MPELFWAKLPTVVGEHKAAGVDTAEPSLAQRRWAGRDRARGGKADTARIGTTRPAA
mgnify:CR=1 FL=1